MKRAFLFLILLLFSAGISGEEHSHGKPDLSKYGTAYKKFTQEMDAGMDKMMKDMHAPEYTGNPDVDFLAMMIPHHEGAVEMARLVLIHGTDPLVRKLAEDIISSQTSEIKTMQQRLKILSKQKDVDPEGFPALGGTRGEKK